MCGRCAVLCPCRPLSWASTCPPVLRVVRTHQSRCLFGCACHTVPAGKRIARRGSLWACCRERTNGGLRAWPGRREPAQSVQRTARRDHTSPFVLPLRTFWLVPLMIEWQWDQGGGIGIHGKPGLRCVCVVSPLYARGGAPHDSALTRETHRSSHTRRLTLHSPHGTRWYLQFKDESGCSSGITTRHAKERVQSVYVT